MELFAAVTHSIVIQRAVWLYLPSRSQSSTPSPLAINAADYRAEVAGRVA
jgi:hypothetical protein